MKLITFFLFFSSFSAWACIGESTYIDFHKAKNKVEVSGDRLIIRHITSLQFTTKMDIEIKAKEVGPLEAPGGLFLYHINSKTINDVTGEVIAMEMSNQKREVLIKLTVKAPQKGGCSKAVIRYY